MAFVKFNLQEYPIPVEIEHIHVRTYSFVHSVLQVFVFMNVVQAKAMSDIAAASRTTTTFGEEKTPESKLIISCFFATYVRILHLDHCCVRIRKFFSRVTSAWTYSLQNASTGITVGLDRNPPGY